ncbi:MAG TPA: DNA polymerase domain-containing protein [Bacteroidota bacterium]|nr:DNA polymerase domain-containing protein [Bacteroidota bacterium]
MRLYLRSDDGIASRDAEFFPFFHIADPTLLEGYPKKLWLKELSGDKYYRSLAAFTRWSDMWEAVRFILDRYTDRLKVSAASYLDVPALLLRPDPVSQYLVQSGVTLFNGMQFEDLHRFQLDIETYSGRTSRFSDPDRPEDRIILIAVSDSRGYAEVLDGRALSEPEMLSRLFGIITEKDPDVIEGHNIYNFDLPYILRRCRLHGVEPMLGRDGIRLKPSDGRQMRTERAMEIQIQDIPGRHIIDTWLLLQTYDHSRRKLESYGLKYAAQHFGFATDNRVYINPDRISWTWDHEPDKLAAYALDDVTETRLLSDLLSPPYFYLSQMTPFNYGTAARNGSVTKIESMIIREYVRQRVSIPSPEPTHPTTGGYADVFQTGVLGPILDIDVESLYPSIMLTEVIFPHSETLGVFSAMLESLTKRRLQAKREMKTAKDTSQKAKLDAVQSSFKILINSFYGYLGYSRGLFNDSIAADRVTRKGQELLRGLISVIGEEGGNVVEVDTDGVFFVPPPRLRTEKAEARFVEKLAATLPEGIVLTLNGRYRSMLSYKAKNYALLGYDGRITLKGSSLTSRSIERFGRRYIRQCIEAILHADVSALHDAYLKLYRDISSNRLESGDFSKTETLRDSPEEYGADVAAGKRNRSAPYEAALRELGSWRRGEKVSYYITGKDASGVGFQNCRLSDGWDPVAPDENVQFYLKRLDEISRKFEPFFTPADFRKIFSTEDLFGFSPEGISIRTDSVVRDEEEGDDSEESRMAGEPRIWLDA